VTWWIVASRIGTLQRVIQFGLFRRQGPLAIAWRQAFVHDSRQPGHVERTAANVRNVTDDLRTEHLREFLRIDRHD
jgi:hypothetical protein